MYINFKIIVIFVFLFSDIADSTVKFDSKGDGLARYTIYNYQRTENGKTDYKVNKRKGKLFHVRSVKIFETPSIEKLNIPCFRISKNLEIVNKAKIRTKKSPRHHLFILLLILSRLSFCKSVKVAIVWRKKVCTIKNNFAHQLLNLQPLRVQ